MSETLGKFPSTLLSSSSLQFLWTESDAGLCHSVPMGTPLIYIQLSRAPANLHSGIPDPRTPGLVMTPTQTPPRPTRQRTCALGETPPSPHKSIWKGGAQRQVGAGRGGPCGSPGCCEGQRRGRRAEPEPSPCARHHAFGLLRHREPLGRLPGGPRSPQQRLLRGRAQRGTTCLSALHHLPHPLHR